jgi:hypothetical protein
MTSIERAISLLLSKELGEGREISADAVRRIYGRVAVQAAIQQVDPHQTLALLDRYGLTREVLSHALQPASVLAVLEA